MHNLIIESFPLNQANQNGVQSIPLYELNLVVRYKVLPKKGQLTF